jgi:hypothetical protein
MKKGPDMGCVEKDSDIEQEFEIRAELWQLFAPTAQQHFETEKTQTSMIYYQLF